jgi:hypothetical protein
MSKGFKIAEVLLAIQLAAYLICTNAFAFSEGKVD